MKAWRKFMILVALLGVVALLGAACGDDESSDIASTSDGLDAHAVEGAYLVNASDFAGKRAADWDNAKKVRVEMNEFAFIPNDLTFETGVPCILELVNTGDVKHEFTAEDFFASVAWRKAESAESEVKVPYFTEIEVFAGKSVELYFVPIVPTPDNPHALVCEIEGHLEAGIMGTVRVIGDPITDPAPVYAPFVDGPWIDNGSDLVAAADCSTMETVQIKLSEFAFEPNVVRLTEGKPYKLVFKNVGDVKHEATAPEFFHNVAFRKIEDASGEFKGPAPLAVETFAGMETELFLIPVMGATYELVCDIEGHFEAGMFGTIIVEPAN
jgi:uncharacterized cupredoxin-like copper-binding protein